MFNTACILKSVHKLYPKKAIIQMIQCDILTMYLLNFHLKINFPSGKCRKTFSVDEWNANSISRFSSVDFCFKYLCWVSAAPRASPQLQWVRVTPRLWCVGSSLSWLLWLRTARSRVWAPWLWRSGLLALWDPPGSDFKAASPALAGRFFTAEPAGKPLLVF